MPLLAGYSASKAALQSLTQALRATLAKSGITVIEMYPGPVDTDLAKGIPLEKVTPEYAATNIVRRIEQGQSYIFPDPMALQIEHLWAQTARVGGRDADRRLVGGFHETASLIAARACTFRPKSPGDNGAAVLRAPGGERLRI